MNRFAALGLSERITKALPELGIEVPTEIQTKAIPLLLKKKGDLIGIAQTGTGKTAAFGLPLLEAINSGKQYPQALILTPTRELGQQVAQNLESYARYLPRIKVLAVYGGASITQQIKALRQGVHVVIATPGRLLDLVRRKSIRLEEIEYLVLDEADEMLNMGFRDDLDTILSHTPADKATWLFSATMPPEIRKIIKTYMDADASEIKMSQEKKININIAHQYVTVRPSDKTQALQRFLDFHEGMSGIIFCRTKAGTQRLADELLKQGYLADALHGDLSQPQRDKVMRRFKAHSLKVIVATDVAARGIDVNNLSHVIHYDLPDDFDYYLHRSGRTARAGKKGISLAFIGGREISKLHQMEKKLDVKFEKIDIPSGVDVLSMKAVHWGKSILHEETPRHIDPSLVEFVENMLRDISKRELIVRLLGRELGALVKVNDTDLNEPVAEKNKLKQNKDMVRFFINIGNIDQVKKKDLLEFICDYAEFDSSSIGTVDIKRNCSFFEVESRHAHSLSAKFKNLVIDGRAIRVNMDGEVKKKHSDKNKSRSRPSRYTSSAAGRRKFKGKGKGKGRQR